MDDDIGSGSVCFDFPSTNGGQLSNQKYVFYGCLTTLDDRLSLDPNRNHYPLITYLIPNTCVYLVIVELITKHYRRNSRNYYSS